MEAALAHAGLAPGCFQEHVAALGEKGKLLFAQGVLWRWRWFCLSQTVLAEDYDSCFFHSSFRTLKVQQSTQGSMKWMSCRKHIHESLDLLFPKFSPIFPENKAFVLIIFKGKNL